VVEPGTLRWIVIVQQKQVEKAVRRAAAISKITLSAQLKPGEKGVKLAVVAEISVS